MKANTLSERCLLRATLYHHQSPNKILIVGDKPGPKTIITKNEVPFCSDKHSSGWLNNQLTIPEEELRWLNAFHFDGTPTSYEDLSKLLPAKKIIALGNVASDWLTSFKIEHIKIYHPQYWKRWRSTERYPLLDLLEN